MSIQEQSRRVYVDGPLKGWELDCWSRGFYPVGNFEGSFSLGIAGVRWTVRRKDDDSLIETGISRSIGGAMNSVERSTRRHARKSKPAGAAP